jgi:hypothetical protein
MTARHYQPRLLEGIDIDADLISSARKNLEVEAVQHTLPHACMHASVPGHTGDTRDSTRREGLSAQCVVHCA